MTPRRAAAAVMTPPTASRDITAAIGNTPMVELPRLAPHAGVRLLAKLEGNNPTGSVKDRVAWAMLSDARATGVLRPGQTILEPSSGNTGISLAMLGSRLGHPVRIVMPDNTTPEREQLLRLYGAEIVFSPGRGGSNGAIRMAEELAAADPSLFMPYQYGNAANPRVARDIDRARDPGPGRQRRRLRRRPRNRWHADGRRAVPEAGAPGVRVVAAEPLPGERVQGLRSLDEGFVPPVFDPSVLDDRLLVTSGEAVIGLRLLLREEGILRRLSSGATIAVALKIASQMERGTVVVLLADGGWKYLSADLWTRDLDQLSDELEGSLLW